MPVGFALRVRAAFRPTNPNGYLRRGPRADNAGAGPPTDLRDSRIHIHVGTTGPDRRIIFAIGCTHEP